MAWESRGSAGRYYTRSRRDGGKVRREYIGCGRVADLVAEADDWRRRERCQKQEQVKQQHREQKAADADVAAWCQRVDLLIRAVLLAAGYHQHKRTWRRWRVANDLTKTAGTSSAVASIPGLGSVEEVTAFLKRAESGDTAILPALRQLLQRPGVTDEMTEMIGGDFAQQLQTRILDRAAGTHLIFKEAWRSKLEAVRQELAGPHPSPVEKLLADRIALTWLQLHDAELRFQQASDMTIVQADYHQRRIDGLSRRYLAAVRSLAQVRKLALPTVQVNIAKKQVNVAG